jgi:S1-C subfamily serine protease
VTDLDWIIVVFALLMGIWGYAQGLIVGGLSLAGFIGGAFAGSRVGPLVLTHGAESPYAPLAALVGALVIGGLLATILELLGFRLRRRLTGALGALDGVAGFFLVGALGLGIAWILGAVALQTPGGRDLRDSIQRSLILRELNARLPPSGPILKALARFDPLPEINGPAPKVRAPDSAIARDPQVRAAGGSVVKIFGTACGLGIQGSGWVAGDGIVVTNAHVVAGQDDTTVQLGGSGPRSDAQAIFYDPHNDIAVLRTGAARGVPPLRLAVNAPPGTSAAVLGFPENGPFDVEPARLGETSTVLTQDAYGPGPVSRKITALRGLVRSGNSGGPVVDGAGRVVTTIFASAVGSGSGSGYGVPDSVVQTALRRAGGPVDTGACAE